MRLGLILKKIINCRLKSENYELKSQMKMAVQRIVFEYLYFNTHRLRQARIRIIFVNKNKLQIEINKSTK